LTISEEKPMVKKIMDEILHSVLVRASPEKAWDALATAQGLDSWFTCGSRIDAVPGGELFLNWEDWGPDHVTTNDTGLVLEAERGKRFVFEWHPDNPTYTTTVEFTFELVDIGTLVRLREHGYHDTDSGLRAMLECAVGWGEALTLLKFYVEKGLVY